MGDSERAQALHRRLREVLAALQQGDDGTAQALLLQALSDAAHLDQALWLEAQARERKAAQVFPAGR